METRVCAADDCANRFNPKLPEQVYCSPTCSSRMRVRRLRARRRNGGGNGGGGGGGIAIERIIPKRAGAFCPIPVIGPKRKPATSTRRQRQIKLPLAVAAAVVLFAALLFINPLPVFASESVVVGVQGASPQDNRMPAKAALRKVVHRKPEPFMPHAHVPEYLLCFVTETLECGHTLDVFPQDDPLIAVRRRCQECDPRFVLIPKKQPQSVRLLAESKRA